MIKLDLHTHSIISPDGSIAESEYEKLLQAGTLDCIAITDHNETKFAKKLHERLGEKIIVGEEITTLDGEMIGLFLHKTIPAGLSAKDTAKAIHEQKGIVYIPHPFETLRKGIQQDVLEQIVDEIDVLEVFNGRGRWRGKNKEADAFSKRHKLVGAASSDAHGIYGVGKTFSKVKALPTSKTIKNLLSAGKLQKSYAPLIAYLYPAINIIRSEIQR